MFIAEHQYILLHLLRIERQKSELPRGADNDFRCQPLGCIDTCIHVTMRSRQHEHVQRPPDDGTVGAFIWFDPSCIGGCAWDDDRGGG
jgi:hypothetical protein